jgi:hypothetical protein
MSKTWVLINIIALAIILIGIGSMMISKPSSLNTPQGERIKL